MRFAAVVRAKQPEPLRTPVAAELIRRLTGDPLALLQPAQPKPQDIPADLDQRVRLVGEW